MKRIFVAWLFVVAFTAQAEAPDSQCLHKAYLKYTQAVEYYWKVKDAEFNKRHPELHNEFSYLIKEQLNHNRMQEITAAYLLQSHPEEFKLQGSLFRMVPRYKHYGEAIYRELRANPEFTRLAQENESYKKENRMPDYDKLKRASESVMRDLDKLPAVIAAKDLALQQANKMVSSLSCTS